MTREIGYPISTTSSKSKSNEKLRQKGSTTLIDCPVGRESRFDVVATPKRETMPRPVLFRGDYPLNKNEGTERRKGKGKVKGFGGLSNARVSVSKKRDLRINYRTGERGGKRSFLGTSAFVHEGGGKRGGRALSLFPLFRDRVRGHRAGRAGNASHPYCCPAAGCRKKIWGSRGSGPPDYAEKEGVALGEACPPHAPSASFKSGGHPVRTRRAKKARRVV